MEIKIPKEIRDYQESIFFGLSVRQFFFSTLAIGVAVGVYFLLREPLGFETVSWVCILCAAPFAAMGFFRYNGLSFEQFILVLIRSEFLMPKHLPFKAENFYELAMRQNPRKDNRSS
jgi:hypothetical protein